MVWGIGRRWPLAGLIGLLNDRKNYWSYSYDNRIAPRISWSVSRNKT
jgi:hypothetical protein